MRHLISPLDLSIEELDEILSLGQAIMQNPEKYSHVCDGKKLATYFLNQVHVLDSVMKQQCLISEAVFLVFLLPIPALQQKGKLLQIRFV